MGGGQTGNGSLVMSEAEAVIEKKYKRFAQDKATINSMCAHRAQARPMQPVLPAPTA
jgi:hypothetical protein